MNNLKEKNQKVFIRVGEKNNFNFTEKEFKSLESFKRPNRKFFVNSNSKVRITSDLPSIVTLNPDVTSFVEPTGNLNNVKAFRIKYVQTTNKQVIQAFHDAIDCARWYSIPILITFFRAISKDTCKKFNMIYGKGKTYEYKGKYFRLNAIEKKRIIESLKFDFGNIFFCDAKGTGCKDCNNCTLLTYGVKGEIKALNLSVSGVKDKNGKQGICPFNCPDCWAKKVTYYKSPACDKLITNRKIEGKVNNV